MLESAAAGIRAHGPGAAADLSLLLVTRPAALLTLNMEKLA
jgi:hypothetical protein